MGLFASLRSLGSSLRRRSELDREMDEELRAHLQNRTDDLARSGLSREQADRQARIEFGGLERFKEEARESAGIHLLETLLQDIRFGLRMLRKSPGFTTVAVLTLALGIGANTAIFSLIDAVMLRMLPVQNPQELVQLYRVNPARPDRRAGSFTNAIWEQLRDHQDIFSGVFAWGPTQFDLAQGGVVRYVGGVFASGGYFSTLGVRPAAGRLLTQADDQRGCPAAAVISYGFWQDHFAGAPSAIGSTLYLNRHPFQIIGVTAPGFYGLQVGSRYDVTVPVCSSVLFDGKESRLDVRDWWWLAISGRVKPGISPEQLKARLQILSPQVYGGAIPQDWEPVSQKSFAGFKFDNLPGGTGMSAVRRQFGQPLTILMWVVGLVLLIACANLASLMIARASSRNREIAVRKALGASGSRIVRQLLTECLLVSTAGALLGILFARWGSALLVRWISTSSSTVFLDLSPNAQILAFTAGIAVVTAVLFGVLPAFRSSRVSLTAAIKNGPGDRSAHGGGVHSGKWIVAGQVAFSLVLLVVAGLFLRSLGKLAGLDLGFDRGNVLIVNANMKDFATEQRAALIDQITERLEALPGVISVSRSTRVPISTFEWSQPVQVDTPNAPKGDAAEVYFNGVSSRYFETLRTPILAGRSFDPTDNKDSAKVAIVNETFARRFFPGVVPVGRYFRRRDGNSTQLISYEIVGVAKDAKYESVREDTYAQAFFADSQTGDAGDSTNFEIRTGTPADAMKSSIQSALARLNGGVSLSFSSLAQHVDDDLVQERLLAALSGFFGGLAVLLAMIGLYGALSHLVHQRTNEFGIRMALGAPRGSVMGLVMRDVVLILGAGVLVGMGVSLLSLRILQKLLFGLSTHDPGTMAGAVLLLAVVALLAGYLPARRAMKVDPMVALRYE